MKEKKGIKPININEDVWFYPVGKHFEFVVYIGHEATQFKVSHRKLRKFLTQPKQE